jgi:hypothetical protein
MYVICGSLPRAAGTTVRTEPSSVVSHAKVQQLDSVQCTCSMRMRNVCMRATVHASIHQPAAVLDMHAARHAQHIIQLLQLHAS